MKYLLFGGLTHYAEGGAHDLLELNNSVTRLLSHIEKDILDIQWWHIYSVEESRIIAASEEQGYVDGLSEEQALMKDKDIRLYTYEGNGWELIK